MPLYEYKCDECGKSVEDFFKMADDAPLCHGPMRKLLSRPRPHKLTGNDERARIGSKICRHNEWYWQRGPGVERLVEDTSGHYDLSKLADATPKRSEQ